MRAMDDPSVTIVNRVPRDGTPTSVEKSLLHAQPAFVALAGRSGAPNLPGRSQIAETTVGTSTVYAHVRASLQTCL